MFPTLHDILHISNLSFDAIPAKAIFQNRDSHYRVVANLKSVIPNSVGSTVCFDSHDVRECKFSVVQRLCCENAIKTSFLKTCIWILSLFFYILRRAQTLYVFQSCAFHPAWGSRFLELLQGENSLSFLEFACVSELCLPPSVGIIVL